MSPRDAFNRSQNLKLSLIIVEPPNGRVARPLVNLARSAGSQCERRVLEPNGYELRGEDVWCPMCAREHPLVEGEQQESTEAKPSVAPSIPQAEIPVPAIPSSMSPGGHSAPVWLSCDSCGKSLPAAQFQQVEGFHICPPCLTTDRDAALHLAKARHRQEMIGLLNKLNES